MCRILIFCLLFCVGGQANADTKKPELSASSNALQPQYDPYSDHLYRAYLWATIVGSGIALIGIGFLLVQTRLTKAAAMAAKGSADSARESTAISRLSMIASDRAYVHQNGFKYISHFDKKLDQYFWRIRPLWINSGNTPTRNLQVYVGYELRDSPLPEDFAFSIPDDFRPIPSSISPKGMIESTAYDLVGQDLAAVSERRKYFYVWGVAKYRDVFPETPQRITKFCCFIEGVSGNPLKAFDEKANPVEIRFPVFLRHNCADEDC